MKPARAGIVKTPAPFVMQARWGTFRAAGRSKE